jgi:hypothetical protein
MRWTFLSSPYPLPQPRARLARSTLLGAETSEPASPAACLFDNLHRENLHSAGCACIVYRPCWNIERVTGFNALVRFAVDFDNPSASKPALANA